MSVRPGSSGGSPTDPSDERLDCIKQKEVVPFICDERMISGPWE